VFLRNFKNFKSFKNFKCECEELTSVCTQDGELIVIDDNANLIEVPIPSWHIFLRIKYASTASLHFTSLHFQFHNTDAFSSTRVRRQATNAVD
jgi:hypothetical protein